MSAVTEIAWTDRTWNPVRGCSLVSEGCRSCYAMKQAHRFSGPGKPYEGLTRLGPKGPTWTGEVRTIESALLAPLSWLKPSRVFVNSMSDLFHEDVPDAFIDRVFAVMALAPQHTFQVLTKRPERMRAYLTDNRRGIVPLAAGIAYGFDGRPEGGLLERADILAEQWDSGGWPLPNVWLGVSVENQHFAKIRIPELIHTPAAVRFVSCEPLLEKVLLNDGCSSWLTCTSKLTMDEYEAMTPAQRSHIDEVAGSCCEAWEMGYGHFHGIDWVIVGGESGPGARPFDLAWARSIVQQCKAASVACFVKQLGAKPMVTEGSAEAHLRMAQGLCVDDCGGVHLKDRKGGDPDEWPADLRVREFPDEARA